MPHMTRSLCVRQQATRNSCQPKHRSWQAHRASLSSSSWQQVALRPCWHMQLHGQCALARAPRRHMQTTAASSDGGSAGTGVDAPNAPLQLPTKLLELYCVVQHPTVSNRPYSKAVQEFVDECIMAYECGFTEQDLASQIGPAASARQSSLAHPGVPPDMVGFTERAFLDSVIIVWCTLLLSKGVRRWSLRPAVTEETLSVWKGFVGMITTAYIEKRMRWFPLDRLQLELSAVHDLVLPSDTVAERARIVFTTLERCFPQFPAD